MKSGISSLLTHYSGGTRTTAFRLKITRTDGEIFGFTSASESRTIDGVFYNSAPGLDVTSIVSSSGLAVDNLELSTLHDEEVFTTGEILTGVWRNAAFSISRYNFANIADGHEVLVAGTIGEVRILQDKVVAELRGLQQYFQQTVGSLTSKTCRARLGDALCTKDLTSFTVSTTVSAVTSNQVFTGSGLAQADDYFGNGELLWTSGDNQGLRALVKQFGSGVITLLLPAFYTVQVGDAFTIIAGCRKRLTEDCKTKFNNVLNFQGEPHLPGIDALTKPP